MLSQLLASLALFPFVFAESWQLGGLKTHFMGPDSGIADGRWPPGSEFNSTIDFTLDRQLDNNITSNMPCSGNWKVGSYPTEWTNCQDSSVNFKFEQTENFTEGLFTLLIQTVRNVSGSNPQTAEVASTRLRVVNNTPGNPDSYLTCLGGEPLSGIRCTSDGFLSSHRDGPIPLVITKSIVPLENAAKRDIVTITLGERGRFFRRRQHRRQQQQQA